jgi:hypothetical protein
MQYPINNSLKSRVMPKSNHADNNSITTNLRSRKVLALKSVTEFGGLKKR